MWFYRKNCNWKGETKSNKRKEMYTGRTRRRKIRETKKERAQTKSNRRKEIEPDDKKEDKRKRKYITNNVGVVFRVFYVHKILLS